MQDDKVLEVVALGFDANDPAALARFWAAALRWDIDEGADGGVELVPTDGTPFGIRFRDAPSEKRGPDRYHLDLTTSSVEDQEETVARLLELGGRHLDIGQGPDERHVVLADPEGNELCIIEPENRFLGDCGRFGALNGDGSQAVGYFWSRVLGWPLIWDQDEETAIRDPAGTGPIIAWGGPPVAPKRRKNRLHLELAPAGDLDQVTAVGCLLALGATRLDLGSDDVDGVLLADPDGNELSVHAA